MSECAAAILAGGRATRMGGRAKSFLLYEGERVIDRQLRVLRPLFAEILIIANDVELYRPLGLPVFSDVLPGGNLGPLAGIVTAVESARAERVVCVACDMPLLSPAALELTRDRAPDADVTVPVARGHDEPLHACYRRTVAPIIRAQLARGDYKINRFFSEVRTFRIPEAELAAIDPTLSFLSNLNAPEDLAGH